MGDASQSIFFAYRRKRGAEYIMYGCLAFAGHTVALFIFASEICACVESMRVAVCKRADFGEEGGVDGAQRGVLAVVVAARTG